eukprot:COSAG01_NODE_4469_length_4997_cov_105.058595_8_plen_77_part_00
MIRNTIKERVRRQEVLRLREALRASEERNRALESARTWAGDGGSNMISSDSTPAIVQRLQIRLVSHDEIFLFWASA